MSNDTDVTIALTNGTSNSSASAPVDGQQLAGRGMQNLGDGADVAAGRRPHQKTFQLVVVVGVRLVDGRQVLGVDDEQAAPHRVGRIAVGHPFQAQQKAVAVRTDRRHHVVALTMIGCLGAQYRARREP